MPEEASPNPAQPPAAPAGGAVNSSPAQPPSSYVSPNTGGKKRALAFIAIGVVLLVVAIVVLLYFLVFSKHISIQAVNSAESATSAMSQDVSDISSTLTSASTTSTESQFNSQLDSVNSKLADAEKQYEALSKSATLKDNATDQKFKALETKWLPYDAYVKNEIKDVQAIFPPLFELDASAQKLQSPTTISGSATYLANYKALVDTADSKLDGVHAILPENQQGLKALDQFLNSVSSDAAAAQKDLTSGNTAAALSSMSKIASAESTLDKAISSADTQSDNHEKQLDPTQAINNLQSALGNLHLQIGS